MLLYNEIFITKKIAEEFNRVLPDWIIIQESGKVISTCQQIIRKEK